MRNFAYGYTDREIGPGRPTPARPTPPLLYHKPQALSIGNLHKKKFGQIFLPENFNHNLRNHHLHPTSMRNHRNRGMGLPAYTYKAEDRLCSKDNPNHLQGNDNVSFFFLLGFIIVFTRGGPVGVSMADFHLHVVIPVVVWTFNTPHFVSLSLSVIIRYYIFGIKSIDKIHKHFAQKLLNLPIDTKFRPWRQYTAGQLYHTFSRLSIGKIHKKISRF